MSEMKITDIDLYLFSINAYGKPAGKNKLSRSNCSSSAFIPGLQSRHVTVHFQSPSTDLRTGSTARSGPLPANLERIVW
jgi:hypothetical protein